MFHKIYKLQKPSLPLFRRIVHLRLHPGQLPMLPDYVMQPGALPVGRLKLLAGLVEHRIQLRQDAMVQRWEHVVQTVIPKACQDGKLGPLHVGPINYGCDLVHAKVDFVPLKKGYI